MKECNYANESFDFRLTMLRFIRNFHWILAFILIGTAIFGGGYYVKNVLLGEAPRYEKTITCKLEYTNPPVQSGDYYINEMTWNTYVDSTEFLAMFENPVTADLLSAKVASDIHVPSFTVSTLQKEDTEKICAEFEGVITGDFCDSVKELASVKVLDVSDTVLVKPDVRPMRAVVLSALLSTLFVVVLFLIREIGADSIWLPATLRSRYGLLCMGTVESAELAENAGHLFKDKQTIALCTVDEETNPKEVEAALVKCNSDVCKNVKWQVVPTPVLSPEAMEIMRAADGVLLVVNAGLHAGKPLEYILEFFATQEITVTATLLWEADEGLIRSYYFLPGGRK